MQRRCYYEILGVPTTALLEEIRSSYKRLALKFHPDKAHSDQVDEHTAIFKEINEAYQVLSDYNERAWYDAHKESFLNPDMKHDEFSGFKFDVQSFLSPECYQKATPKETEEAFYTTYGDVFAKILIEEENARNDQGLVEMTSFLKAPAFGDAGSDLESVRRFYDFWGGFTSCKSFAWADPFDIREVDGRVLKWEVERENKKKRQEAKREYMSVVRQLIEFVTARDHRLVRMRERDREEKERKAAKKKAEEEKRASDWKARKDDLLRQEMEEYERMNVQRATEQMLEQEVAQMKLKPKSGFEETEEDYEEEYKCDICKKKFKSLGMLGSHLDSRDHIKKEKKWQEANGIVPDKTAKATKGGATEPEAKAEPAPAKKDPKGGKKAPKKQEAAPEVEEPVEEEKETKASKKAKTDAKKKKEEEAAKTSCQLCKKAFESRAKLFAHLEEVHGYERKH